MVRLDSGAEDSAIVFLEVLGWVFVFCSFYSSGEAAFMAVIETELSRMQ
jgi:hypothetical protein